MAAGRRSCTVRSTSNRCGLYPAIISSPGRRFRMRRASRRGPPGRSPNSRHRAEPPGQPARWLQASHSPEFWPDVKSPAGGRLCAAAIVRHARGATATIDKFTVFPNHIAGVRRAKRHSRQRRSSARDVGEPRHPIGRIRKPMRRGASLHGGRSTDRPATMAGGPMCVIEDGGFKAGASDAVLSNRGAKAQPFCVRDGRISSDGRTPTLPVPARAGRV